MMSTERPAAGSNITCFIAPTLQPQTPCAVSAGLKCGRRFVNYSVYGTPRKRAFQCSAVGEKERRISRRNLNRLSAGLSLEFLGVSGMLGTLASVLAMLIVAIIGVVSPGNAVDAFNIRPALVALMSFSYALMLQQFDLHKLPRLRLTITLVLGTRFIVVPALSHIVAILGYAFANAITTSKASIAAAVVANAKAKATAQATAKSLSLPSAVLSSLFLLSTTPVGYSPSAALLSPHIYPTLLAHLTLLALLLFPILPGLSYAMNRAAHNSSLFNVAGTLPLVGSPPGVSCLLLTTTIPALVALVLQRMLPPRARHLVTFCALPCAWLFSTVLMCYAVRALVSGGMTGLAGSVGLCCGVVAFMCAFARVLGAVLRLDERAKRTLMLYLSTQGAVVGASIAPQGFASAPPVAAAIVGLCCTAVFAQRWSKVIIRTSTDIH